MIDAVYDLSSNVMIVDGVRLVGMKGFPPYGESNVPFQSKPHYVRFKGLFDTTPYQCIYHYTHEGWFRADNGNRLIQAVEYWY